MRPRSRAFQTLLLAFAISFPLHSSLDAQIQSRTISDLPYVSSIVLTPQAVVGGGRRPVQGTVTTSVPMSRDTFLTLTSSNAAAALPPPSVLVPGGQSSATFNVTTYPVRTDTALTITAAMGSLTRSVPMTVYAPTLASLTLSSSSVIGGIRPTAIATLNGPAPEGGIVIPLRGTMSVNGSSVAIVPGSVTIAASQFTASVPVDTYPVSANQSLTISGGPELSPRIANLAVLAPAVASLTLDNASVFGGLYPNATVTLTGPAPQGFTVPVTTTGAASSVPLPDSQLVFAAGQSSASFQVATRPVAVDTTDTITAGVGTVRTAQLTVKPPVLKDAFFMQKTIRGDGWQAVQLMVTLTARAGPGGIAFTVTSSAPEVLGFSSWAATFAEGHVDWTAILKPKPVNANTNVTATATLGSITKTAEVLVTPPQIVGFTFPIGTVQPGNTVYGHVTMNGPIAAGGAFVSVASNHPEIVPSSTIAVTQGSVTCTFPVTPLAVTADTTVTLTATFAGSTMAADVIVSAH